MNHADDAIQKVPILAKIPIMPCSVWMSTICSVGVEPSQIFASLPSSLLPSLSLLSGSSRVAARNGLEGQGSVYLHPTLHLPFSLSAPRKTGWEMEEEGAEGHGVSGVVTLECVCVCMLHECVSERVFLHFLKTRQALFTVFGCVWIYLCWCPWGESESVCVGVKEAKVKVWEVLLAEACSL